MQIAHLSRSTNARNQPPKDQRLLVRCVCGKIVVDHNMVLFKTIITMVDHCSAIRRDHAIAQKRHAG
jgi:hypothetical protein